MGDIDIFFYFFFIYFFLMAGCMERRLLHLLGLVKLLLHLLGLVKLSGSRSGSLCWLKSCHDPFTGSNSLG